MKTDPKPNLSPTAASMLENIKAHRQRPRVVEAVAGWCPHCRRITSGLVGGNKWHDPDCLGNLARACEAAARASAGKKVRP